MFGLFGRIKAPVMELVEKVKENPKTHQLGLVSENHIKFNLNGDTRWRVSIAHHGLLVWANDTAEWMTEKERRYVYRQLRPLCNAEEYTRQGWINKVAEEE